MLFLDSRVLPGCDSNESFCLELGGEDVWGLLVGGLGAGGLGGCGCGCEVGKVLEGLAPGHGIISALLGGNRPAASEHMEC